MAAAARESSSRQCTSRQSSSREKQELECDEYGFALVNKTAEETNERQDRVKSESAAVCQRWREVMADCQSSDLTTRTPVKRKCLQLIRSGGYNSIRGDVWKFFLSVSETKRRNTFDFEGNVLELRTWLGKHDLSEMSCDSNIRRINDVLVEKSLDEDDRNLLSLSRQIMLDIVRTFPTHHMFIGETKEKISLFRVLMIYSKFNSSVGYCQGMAYVAALLLMHISNEEEVFWSIVTLFDSERYLSGFYDTKLSRMKSCADVFSLMLKDRQTQLAQHLESLSIHPLMYLTSWFMCLFTSLPSWDTVLSLCDLLFLQGYECLFRGALAILEVCSAELLAMDQIESVLPFIQNIPSRLSSHQVLFPVVMRTSVTESEVEDYLNLIQQSSVPGSVKSLHEVQFRTPNTRIKKDLAAESTPVTRSLFSRILTALTPVSTDNRKSAKPTATIDTQSLASHSVSRECSETAGSRSNRKRKRDNLENSVPTSNECAVEMKEFSKKRRIHSSSHKARSLFISPSLSLSPSCSPSPSTCTGDWSAVCETPSSQLTSLLTPSLETSSVRRSERVAKRRRSKVQSLMRRKLPPILSFASPMEQSIQERLNGSGFSNPERIAFQTFATATPLKP